MIQATRSLYETIVENPELRSPFALRALHDSFVRARLEKETMEVWGLVREMTREDSAYLTSAASRVSNHLS